MTDAWTRAAEKLLKAGLGRKQVARVLSAAKAFDLDPENIAIPYWVEQEQAA